MRKLYKLELDNNLKINKKIKNYLDPKYIYLPIEDFSFFEEKDYIYKNKVVFETNNIDFISSISGNLKKMQEVTINNKLYNGIVIKNDFKEKEVKYKIKETNEYKDLISLLNKNYLYKNINKNNIENIVINSIEDEPYSKTESYILNNNMDIIYDTLEKLNKIYNSKNNFITIKNTDTENVNKYLSTIGSYPTLNVVVIEDLYLIGKKEFLLEKINLNKDKTIILKPSEVLEIRNNIKYGINKSDKYITLVNLIAKKIEVINLKKYMLVKDVINKFNNNYVYIKNGLMSGIIINPETEIIDETFNMLVIAPLTEDLQSKCINCGKCSVVCPINGNAKKVMETKIKNNNCLDCSLCSYFCPSKINLRKYIKGEYNE